MTTIANSVLEVRGNASATLVAGSVIKRGYLDQFIFAGTKFEWVSNSQVRLVPFGVDGFARVPLWDGSAIMGFSTSSNITADITSSGANGLDTGAEAASTFYYVWAIGKSDGTFALLLSTSSSSPTMPSGYTFKRLIWGVANDGSSNLADFEHHHDGKCQYKITQFSSVAGINLLAAGTATSVTAVSAVKAAPDIVGVSMGIQFRPANINNTNSVFTFSEDSGQTSHFVFSRTIGQTGAVVNAEHYDNMVARNTGSLATSIYYQWGTNTANLGADVYVQWWNIGTGW